ncbi:hypothetical protein PRK78_004915 [Emydomyces testavorans]|uniref:N-acetylgalactosaminide beta-1,3-galactosyltransferase n=1 Tax=Emydomyces testavorans TaxID=2070801 RepID=A0AAF0IK83_9EURO|nr:hypothetical protein PRK78_004915 [Emydomyces testavorans]
MDDILVILKTGVTEALEKVPIHFETTLQCVPHYAVFSDCEEEIAGVRTYDVLRNVSESIKKTNSDFELYNRIRKSGRDGLRPSDLMLDDVSGPAGKPNNPGWKLDKWKFLPMMDEALEVRPNAKWYVFMEADTYIIWPNLLAWLAKLDATKPYYLGTQMMMGETIFAYGGSGFVISNPAMKSFSKYRASRLAELDEYTANQWAGDAVLGQILLEAGIPLTHSWPMLQTARIWNLDHFELGFEHKLWCFPAVSYHHMTPGDVEIMWQFDQQWFRSKSNSLLLHRDVFTQFIQPGLSAPRDNWDNGSKDEQNVPSGEDCEARCADDSECLQYSYRSDKCFTSKAATRGVATPSSRSGWMTDRIKEAAQGLGSCDKPEWIH